MGILNWLSSLFVSKNVVVETVEVFRPNAEKSAQRSADGQAAALQQFSSEFQTSQDSWFNAFVNGLNRLPRPIITYTVFGMFAMVFYDPLRFSAMMQSLTLVPDQLWELMSIIVMFFFGARELSHFRASSVAKEAARITAAAPQVVENIRKMMDAQTPLIASTDGDAEATMAVLKDEPNEAVSDYRTRSN